MERAMLSIAQVTSIVRNSLRKLAPAGKTAGDRKQLKTLGITGPALRTFKAALAESLEARGVQVTVRQLNFSETSTIAAVCKLVLTRFAPPTATSRLPGDASPGPRRPSPPSAAKARPVAKAKAPSTQKKVAKKAVPAKKSGGKLYVGSIDLSTIRKEVHDAVQLTHEFQKVQSPFKRARKTKGFGFIISHGEEVQRPGIIKLPSRPQTAISIMKPLRYKDKNVFLTLHHTNSPFGNLTFDGGTKQNGTDAPGGGSTASATPPTLRTLEATPQIEIVEELEKATLYKLEVFLDQQAPAPGADIQKVSVEFPSNLKELPVEVWFDCSSHFKLENLPTTSQVTLQVATGVSDHLPFNLRVLPVATADADVRPMFVSAFFRYNSRPCGKITRYLKRTTHGINWQAPTQTSSNDGEVVLPRDSGTPAVRIEATAEPADIRIEVMKTEANDGQHFTLRCFTPQGDWSGPWNLPQVSKDLVNAYMQRFMAAKGKARINRLKSAGTTFWDALPDAVRPLLWSAITAGANSMSILSQEPYIPWELMIPYQQLRSPRKALGVELRVGRWVTGDYTSPPQTIQMRSAYIVCPTTSGLASSNAELTFLTSLPLHPNAPIQPASYDGLDDGLSGDPRDIVHFICHGKSATIQTLQLDTPDTLDCSEIRNMPGFQHAFEHGTFAFLNACEVGGQVLALDGVGGFANSFIELGASAVVAPLWPVQDAAALQVSQLFYNQVLAGSPLAEALKFIRAKAYDEAIDSYAAYCFYGDPAARAGILPIREI
jgi:hypothetical protein